MKLGNKVTGRKPLHLPPSSDLDNEVQGVRKEETTRKQILSRSEYQPFRSLAERGIETVPVKPGLLTRALSSLSSSFISFFSSAISSVTGATQKEFRNLINDELENQESFKRDIEDLEHSLKLAEESLQRLRKSIEVLTPEQMDHYIILVKKQLSIKAQLVLKKAYLTRSAEQVRSYEQSLPVSKRKLEQSMKVLEENISTGIQALALMKDVFKRNRKDKHRGKVFEMRLGDVKVTDPDRYDFQVKNLVLNTSRFCFEKGLLELEVPEISADCFSLEEDKAVGPIKMKGSCRVCIGEPLAEPLNHLLTCRKTETFSAYKKCSEAFGALYAETSGSDAKRHLGDVIQCSLDGLETEERGVKSDLFMQAMGEALIRLFAPMVTTWKKELGADSLKKSREREDGFAVKANATVGLYQSREKTVKMLEEDLPGMKESKAKKACQVMLASCRKDLQRARKLLKQRQEELSKQKQRTAAMMYREANAGQSIHSYQNALKLFHTLRGLAKKQASDPSTSASMGFGEQRIDFTDTAHGELSSASLKFSGFRLGEEGVFEIKVPDVVLNLGLVNEVSDTREAFPVSLKEVSVKVNPPMGEIVHQLLQLDFPLEFRKLERLWKQYQACTSEHYNSIGTHNPLGIGSYLSVDLGSVACLAAGDVRVEARERPVADKEWVALAISDLMGKPHEVSKLDQLFQEKMGMNPQSSNQVMNLLCLGLLGELEPLSAPDEQKELSTHEIPSSFPKEIEVTPVINEKADISTGLPSQIPEEIPAPLSESSVSHSNIKSEPESEPEPERKEPAFNTLQENPEKAALPGTEIYLGDLSHCPEVSQVKLAVKGDTPQVSFALKVPALKVLGKLPLLFSWLVGSDLALSVQAPLKEDIVQFRQPFIKVRGARVPLLGPWLANFWLKRAMARGQLAINTHQVEGQAGLQLLRVDSA
ncbi:hypothetical protein [Endozoicomonas sp. ALB032]|uniref:hypothetical protein n=1 Tax=Endozoicomonas sp. ALB032 TaxID=3403082 RepID=UPI003BB53A31